MSFWNILSGLVKPVTDLIDDLHTSDEEKLKIKTEFARMQNEVSRQLIEYEGKLLDARANIVIAEAQGQSWLQRSWRPITMLTFLILVVCDAFGLLAFRLAEEAWVLLQIGLGGYVVGRSAEKIAPSVKDIIAAKSP